MLDGPANGGLDPVCEEAPYPRYEPSTYEVLCIRAEVYRKRLTIPPIKKTPPVVNWRYAS